ncbi:MAG: tyrosine-type recombinase/integrase [Tissierellia bacterium]|nr:tyrosine-type recombinase/integrase [Tissierellia bacterium]
MEYHINTKGSKPQQLIREEIEILDALKELELNMPLFMRDYFIFLRGSVAPSTALAYIRDIEFFFSYLLGETLLSKAEIIKDITLEDLAKLRSRDLNEFLGDYCRRYYKEIDGELHVFENNNASISRKRSSLSSLFRFFYRNEQLKEDLSGGLNPIRMPKPQPDAIKRLHKEEITELLYVVETGDGLSEKELIYWEKTKYRDRAILLFFITYGLRLRELANLDISSFHFGRKEFTVYRKRDKQTTLPLNDTTQKALDEYLNLERAPAGDDALFLSLQGTRITQRAIRDLVKKYTALAMKTSRSQGYSPHKLRATAASTLIERGFSIYDVQNLLDHDNVTTTQLYAAHKKNVKADIIMNFELDEGKKSP